MTITRKADSNGLEDQIMSRVRAETDLSVGQLRQRLPDIDRSDLSLALLTLVNKQLIELTPDRKLRIEQSPEPSL